MSVTAEPRDGRLLGVGADAFRPVLVGGGDVLFHERGGAIRVARGYRLEDRVVLGRVALLPAGRGHPSSEQAPAEVERPEGLEHPHSLLVPRRAGEPDVELTAHVVR